MTNSSVAVPDADSSSDESFTAEVLTKIIKTAFQHEPADVQQLALQKLTDQLFDFSGGEVGRDDYRSARMQRVYQFSKERACAVLSYTTNNTTAKTAPRCSSLTCRTCADCQDYEAERARHTTLVYEAIKHRSDPLPESQPQEEPAPGTWLQRCAAPDCGQPYRASRSSSKTCSARCRQSLARTRKAQG
jgi:hypothetical protein